MCAFQGLLQFLVTFLPPPLAHGTDGRTHQRGTLSFSSFSRREPRLHALSAPWSPLHVYYCVACYPMVLERAHRNSSDWVLWPPYTKGLRWWDHVTTPAKLSGFYTEFWNVSATVKLFEASIKSFYFMTNKSDRSCSEFKDAAIFTVQFLFCYNVITFLSKNHVIVYIQRFKHFIFFISFIYIYICLFIHNLFLETLVIDLSQRGHLSLTSCLLGVHPVRRLQ